MPIHSLFEARCLIYASQALRAVIATIVLPNRLRSTFGIAFRQHAPGERFKSLLIPALSRTGLGPNRNPFEATPRGLLSGLPARLAIAEPGRDCRGPGGAELGRVDICKAGIFSKVRGRTSSRLIGIPRAIKCCLLIRDRIQFTGCICGVERGIYAWNISLLKFTTGLARTEVETIRAYLPGVTSI